MHPVVDHRAIRSYSYHHGIKKAKEILKYIRQPISIRATMPGIISLVRLEHSVSHSVHLHIEKKMNFISIKKDQNSK